MNHFDIEQNLQAMWEDYLAINPQAQQIHKLFSKLNPNLLNDHIALRTFDLPSVNIDKISRPFIAAGYQVAGEYDFPVKKLIARHYEHPDLQHPKIFISQLLTTKLSTTAQKLIQQYIKQIPDDALQSNNFSYSGRHWQINYSTYQQLLKESEYAAWVCAFGFRPNHFTILINSLTSHHSINEVNDFLLKEGFELNSVGGLIKGSPSDYLEQSSTLANTIPVAFSDGVQTIPGCYYEFARRYPLPSGDLFQGFVAASADKIFQSTDTR